MLVEREAAAAALASAAHRFLEDLEEAEISAGLSAAADSGGNSSNGVFLSCTFVSLVSSTLQKAIALEPAQTVFLEAKLLTISFPHSIANVTVTLTTAISLSLFE